MRIIINNIIIAGAVTNPNEDFSGEEKTEPLTEVTEFLINIKVLLLM